MKATIEKQTDGSEILVLRVPLITPPRPSTSGKVLLIASESGKTELVVKGKTVSVGLNAYIKP